VSIGAGVSWQRVEAELTKATNFSFVASAGGIPGVPNNSEGSNKIEGDDDGWGFNLGILIKLAPSTDLGFSYRSSVNYTLSGTASFAGRPAAVNAVLAGAAGAAAAAAAQAQVGDSAATANLKLPASASLAFRHQFDARWELLADVTWTEWSTLKSLDIIRDTGVLLESTPFNWKDTWRAGLGLNYRLSEPWTIRFGIAFDETPTQDAFRTPRVPDQDRKWIAIGGQYRMSKEAVIDFGYAHLFMSDASINLSGPPAITTAQAAGRGRLVGSFDDKVDILSVQLRYGF
jgi:long-chain fatty acid transport protein